VPTEPIPDVAETCAWGDEHTVTLRQADPGHELAGVRLALDWRIPGDRLGFPVPAVLTCDVIEETWRTTV
jgi:hypothetical protein